MSRFYIGFQRGDRIARDDEGQDLPGLEEAKAVALASARELIADAIKAGADSPVEAIIIFDENGEDLLTIQAKVVLPDALK